MPFILNADTTRQLARNTDDFLCHVVQLRELYRMYLQNAEVPAKFSTLLQLREMLAIRAAEAEALEDEILSSGASFSI